MVEFRADPDSAYYEKSFSKDKPVILYCAAGGRAALSGQVLKEMGYGEVYNLGGFADWPRAAELSTSPDRRPTKCWAGPALVARDPPRVDRGLCSPHDSSRSGRSENRIGKAYLIKQAFPFACARPSL
jgi:hypothetical protein